MGSRFLTRLFSSRKTAARSRHFRNIRPHLRVESLDARDLPSVTVNLSGGILDIVADDAANQVQLIQPVPDQVSVLESDNVVATFARSDVQLALFQYGTGTSTFDNTTDIPDHSVRLFTSAPLTPDQLSQSGSLDAVLVDNLLTFAGPSGAAFQITGAWAADTEDAGDGQLLHTFTASGPLVLHSALGDIPFTTSDDQPLTITTNPNTLQANFGDVAGVSWTASLIDTVSTDSVLRQFTDQFGIQVTTGTVQVNVQLGSDLAGNGLPLNAGLPYISINTTDYTAQFGANVASPGADDPLTLAFDPADPALYVQTNEFTIAGSLKGQIPYQPVQDLPGLADNPIYGHLYGLGSFRFGDLPMTFNGDAVVNLDAAHDGALLSHLTGNLVVALYTNQTALNTLALLAPGDLRVGLNGSGSLQYALGNFTLTLPDSVSAAYEPGHIALHGLASGNPFAGTPLQFLGITQTVEVTADVDASGAFDLTATTNVGTVAGVSVASWGVELNNSGITLDAHLAAALGFGDIDIHGTVGSDGQFVLTTSVQKTIAGFVLASGTLTLNNNGLILAGQITVPNVADVQIAGFVDNQGLFALTGDATATMAGFTAHDAFTLNNTRLNVEVDLTIPQSGTILVHGMVDTSGHYQLDGRATLTVHGFTLDVDGLLTNSNFFITADVTIPGGGRASLTGSVSNTGQWSLSGQATLTVDGFTLVDAQLLLSNTQMTVSVALAVPSVGIFALQGTANADGSFRLQASGTYVVAGFGLANATVVLTNTSLTVSAGLAIPQMATIQVSGTVGAEGSVRLSGTASVTLAGYELAQAAFTLTATELDVTADTNIPVVGQTHFAGTVTSTGQFSLTASYTRLVIAGYPLLSGSATLTNTELTVHGQATLIPLGQVTFAGRLTPDGQFTLTAGSPRLTVSGHTLTDVVVTLTNSGMTAQANALLPQVGQVHFAGRATIDGQASLTATAANLTINGYLLTNLRVTLDNRGVSLDTDISAPLLGQAHFAGLLQADGHFALTVTAARLTVQGFTLTNVTATLTEQALTLAAQANLPPLGAVQLDGIIQAGGAFSFTVHAADIHLQGYTLTQLVVTLANDGLHLAARVSLPYAGTVTVIGAIDPSGQFAFVAQAAPFTIGTFTLENGRITFTNTRLTVSAQARVGSIGQLSFDGTINADGTYNLHATATVTVAGFTLASSDLAINNDRLSVQVCAPLNGLGQACFSGSYTTADGRYSLQATVPGPVYVNGVPLRDLSTRLTNDGLTAHVTAGLPNLVTATFDGTLTPHGDYQLTARVDAFVVNGYSLASGVLTLTNTQLTVQAHLTVPNVAQLDVSGYYIFATGHYFLTGAANVSVGGFPVLTAGWMLDNNGLTLGGQVNLPQGGTVQFHGTVSAGGQFNLAASATFIVGGYHLADAALILSNAGLAVFGNITVPRFGEMHFNGTLTPDGQFNLSASISLTVANFTLSNAALILTNTSLTVTGLITVPGGTQVRFSGLLDSSGQFTLQANANLTVSGFTLTAGMTLTNSGLSLAAQISFPQVGWISATGTLTSGGQYSLSGNAQLTLNSFQLTASYQLTNAGLTFSAQATVPPIGQVTLTGSVASSGQYDFRASANVTLAGFGVAEGQLRLTNAGMSLSGKVSVPSGNQVAFAGTVTVTGQYNLIATANLTVANFALVSASLTLTNQEMTVSSQVTVPTVGQFSFHGTVTTAGAYRLEAAAALTLNRFQADVSLTLTNSGLAISGRFSIPLVGWVSFSGTVTAAGQFDLSGQASVILADFTVANGAFRITNAGMSVTGQVMVPLKGQVQFTGTVLADGHYLLQAHTTLAVAGFSLDAGLTLTNDSLAVNAQATVVNVGQVQFSGTVTSAGQYTLTASATFTVAGFPITSAGLTLTNTSLTVSASVNVAPAGVVRFNGTVTTAGQFDLLASAVYNVAGFHLATSLELTNSGVTVTGQLNLPTVGWIQVTGTVSANGQYRVTGRSHFTVSGFQMDATLTLTNPGLNITAAVVVTNVGTFTMDGSVSASGRFVLTFAGVFRLTRIAGSGSLTLTNDGMQVQFHLDSTVMNAHLTVSGWISYTGTYTLQGDIHTGHDRYDSSITFTLTQTEIRGHVNWAHYGDGCWIGSFDTNFSFNFDCTINANGGIDLNGSGTFRVTVHTPWPFPDFDIDLHLTLSTHGLHVSVPWPFDDFDWSF